MDPQLKEIISDLNLSIADVETYAATGAPSKDVVDSFKRAVGQLKAARASLLRTTNPTKQIEVTK